MALPLPRRLLVDVYDAADTGVPNWELGRPQTDFVALVEAGLVRGPVLDVGCGTGELSLFLARGGHDVIGIDLSAVAIRQAREEARWRRNPAQFLRLDALDVSEFRTRDISLNTVVGSGMFHVLGDRERDRFVAALGAVVRPGGLYCVLGDAPRNDDGYGITPAELRQRFGDGWAVVFAYRTTFRRRWGNSPAYFVGLRRT